MDLVPVESYRRVILGLTEAVTCLAKGTGQPRNFSGLCLCQGGLGNIVSS